MIPSAPPFALFAAPGGTPGRDALLYRNPVEIVTTTQLNGVRDALDAVDRGAARGLHAAGFVSYDAAPAFDPALSVRPGTNTPLVWFGLFAAPELVVLPTNSTIEHIAWTPNVSRDEYDAAITQLRDAIERGDVYQVNHTLRFHGAVPGSAVTLFQQLWSAQQTDLAAYFDIGSIRLLSASPELFFARTDNRVVTRPMKGTAPRGRWTAEDDALAKQLAASEKECAENLMIVDLLRNDLGRIATTGSVSVEQLLQVERYPTVLQLTSTVAATLPAATPLSDVFGALFPCGSVTGAPKVAAMRHIAALESTPRGVYCGALGRVEPNGNAIFSVAIRTVCIDTPSETAEYGAGGGITWDSVARAEYGEVQMKAAVLTTQRPTFSLLETLRLEDGCYQRLDAHLARLTDSARYFGFSPVNDVPDALQAHAQEHPNGTHRVRLLLDRNGQLRVESTPHQATLPAPWRVALARSPIDRHNIFLHHKTTHRAIYQRHRAEHPNVDEVLLWNEEGELTEFTIGNLVVELDGARYTPPRTCGLLAGIFRDELLHTGAITERTLYAHDLDTAIGLWLINSLREWMKVEVSPLSP